MQDVAVPVSRASGVGSVTATPPARNTSRDVQRKKAVSEQINLHGMVDISGDSAIVKGKFFSRFNVAKGHDDYKCAIARPVLKKGRCILTASPTVLLSKTPRVLRICATIFFIHHAEQFDERIHKKASGSYSLFLRSDKQ